jgi:hypothetical protein
VVLSQWLGQSTSTELDEVERQILNAICGCSKGSSVVQPGIVASNLIAAKVAYFFIAANRKETFADWLEILRSKGEIGIEGKLKDGVPS